MNRRVYHSINTPIYFYTRIHTDTQTLTTDKLRKRHRHTTLTHAKHTHTDIYRKLIDLVEIPVTISRFSYLHFLMNLNF